MPARVQKAMIEWCNRGNPSSGYPAARESRAMMNKFRDYIGVLCSIDPCCVEDRDSTRARGNLEARRRDPSEYKIIFTSGASEANCTILNGIVSAYSETVRGIPHIVMSAIEHKSLIDQAKSFESRGCATVTFVNPDISGHVQPAAVEAAIKPNTCIVCVMHANNETGAINDIEKIGKISHKHNIPFHCDTVQTFGKNPLNPTTSHVDSFCISFHKFQGPPGIGALVIKQQLLSGYKLSPMIFGSQNESLRGGTENLPGIGAAFDATKLTMNGRTKKNSTMSSIKKYIIDTISTKIPSQNYRSYITASGAKPEIEIVFLSEMTGYLSNTILLSVVKRTKPPICNTKMREELERRGIVVSVGSACNTANTKASHVLYAMGANDLIRRGALRISLGDDTTIDDAKKFIIEFMQVIKLQI